MITYTNEDCLTGMARYPDQYFQLAICDPPYGINIGSSVGGGGVAMSSFRNKGNFGGGYVIMPKKYDQFDDSKIPDAAYFKELFRVSKNQIIWGGNYFIEHLRNTSCMIVWDKDNAGTHFADCELAWTSFKTAVRKFEFRWNGMLQGDMKNREVRIHQCHKPVALYKFCLTNYAQPGDRILDTHVGSASSLIACHDLGFDAVGFELIPSIYEKSKTRLEDFMRQPRLIDFIDKGYEQITL